MLGVSTPYASLCVWGGGRGGGDLWVCEDLGVCGGGGGGCGGVRVSC